jgi:hypothetical protein
MQHHSTSRRLDIRPHDVWSSSITEMKVLFLDFSANERWYQERINSSAFLMRKQASKDWHDLWLRDPPRATLPLYLVSDRSVHGQSIGLRTHVHWLADQIAITAGIMLRPYFSRDARTRSLEGPTSTSFFGMEKLSPVML